MVYVRLAGQKKDEDFAEGIDIGAWPRFDTLELLGSGVPKRSVLLKRFLRHQS